MESFTNWLLEKLDERWWSRSEAVMIRTGLFPPLPEETHNLKEANLLLAQLSNDEQEMLLTQMRALVEQRHGNYGPAVERA